MMGNFEPAWRVHALDNILARSLRDRYRKHGVSLPMYYLHILEGVPDEKPLPMGQLECRLDFHRATFYRHLDNLEKMGLVERKKDTIDQRFMNIKLTPEGREIRDRARSAREEWENDVFGGASRDEFASFMETCAKFAKQAKNAGFVYYRRQKMRKKEESEK